MSLMARYRKPKEESTVSAGTNPPNGSNGFAGSLLLDLKQASEYVGLPLRRIRILVANGDIRHVPMQPQKIYVARVELDRYVTSLIKQSLPSRATCGRVRIDDRDDAAIRPKPRVPNVKRRLQKMTDDQLRKYFGITN